MSGDEAALVGETRFWTLGAGAGQKLLTLMCQQWCQEVCIRVPALPGASAGEGPAP